MQSKEYFREHYQKNKEKKRLYALANKEKISERMKIYYSDNLEKIKAKKVEYQENNRESIQLRSKRYYTENKEILLEKSREYHNKNKDSVREQHRLYQREHKNEIAKKSKIRYLENRTEILIKKSKYGKINRKILSRKGRIYQSKNSEELRIYHHNRRSSAKRLPYTLTVSQWKETKEHFNSECAYCGECKPLTHDHFYPLVKGGEYTRDNIIPACKSCNSSKQDSLFDEWYPKQEFFNIKRQENIFHYLGYNKGLQQLTLV